MIRKDLMVAIDPTSRCSPIIAKLAVFEKDDTLYIVCPHTEEHFPDGTTRREHALHSEDRDKITQFYEKDCAKRVKWCYGAVLDREGDFFLTYCADCFDPPMAIVRGESAQDAASAFVEEFSWARISEEEADKRIKEYGDNSVALTEYDGHFYDPETVMVEELRLVTLQF